MDVTASYIIDVDADGAVRGAKKAGKALKGTGNAAAGTTKKVTALSGAFHLLRSAILPLVTATAIIGFFTSGIRAATKFEQAIADLSAITGATGKDLKFLSDAAKEFGRSTTFGASEATEAFKLVASAKPELLENAAALKEVTAQTIILSEAAGTTLAESAVTLGSALNQFSEGADEAGRFINVLAAGAKFGASEITDTSEALKMAGVVASNAGISFEQTNAAIQLLAGGAIKASMAGTGLRGVILKLTTQANNDFNPSIVGMEQAFINLRDSEMSATEQKKLFGEEGITSAQILMKEAEQLSILTKKLTGTNTAYDQAAIRTDTFQASLKRLGNAWETFTLAINDSNSALKTFVDLITESINWWTAFINAGSGFEELSEKIRDTQIELGNLIRHRESVRGGGLISKLLYGSESDLDAEIDETRSRLTLLNNEMLNSNVSDAATSTATSEQASTGANAGGGGAATGPSDDSVANAIAKEQAMQEALLEIGRQGMNKKQLLEADFQTQQTELHQIILDGNLEQQEAAWALLEEGEGLHQKRLTEINAAEQSKRKAMEDNISKHAIAAKKAVFTQAVGFLQLLGTKNKAFAVAAIILEKALAIQEILIKQKQMTAQTVMYTAAAMQLARATYPPPMGDAIAAKYAADGAAAIATINAASAGAIALTAATGAIQVSSIGAESSGAGEVGPVSGAPFVGGSDAFSDIDTAQQNPANNAVTVNIVGDIYGWDDYVQDKIIGAIKEAVTDRDVILVTGDSRNAQEIVNSG